MTPAQWQDLVKSDAPAYAFRNSVAHAARVHLSTLNPDQFIKSEQLVEALFPREEAEKTLAGDTARKRIYISIYKLASIGMEDCAVKGEVNGTFMGKPKRPWLWFNPGNLETCFACGQLIPPGLVV